MTNQEIPNLTAFDDAALDQAFAAVEAEARAAASTLTDESSVEAFRLQWLGRKQGRLTEISARWLKSAPPEAKKSLGLRFNALKDVVEGLLSQAAGSGPTDAALAAEIIDITLPGTRRLTGAEHPITRTLNEITRVFAALGYSVGVGPEVETDFYNFESMNFPPGHPARDTQDTLVVANQERRPCALLSPARFTATTRKMRRTRPSSTRSKASASTPTSPSVTSKAHSTTP